MNATNQWALEHANSRLVTFWHCLRLQSVGIALAAETSNSSATALPRKRWHDAPQTRPWAENPEPRLSLPSANAHWCHSRLQSCGQAQKDALGTSKIDLSQEAHAFI
eukprot:4156442-Amphidinium_carterae.2